MIYGQLFAPLIYMKKKDINRVDLGKNPFLNDFKIPIRRISKTEYEADGTPRFGSYDMELQAKCSLYVDPAFRKSIFQLKGASAQLMLWVMQKVETGNDYIHIKRETCMKELEMSSKNTYRAAIKGLCENNILGAIYGVPDIFWVNPKLYFKGQRSKVFTDNTEPWEPNKYELKIRNENKEEE